MSVQPPISTIPCKILYLLANSVLPFPMFSSPAASPTNRSPHPRPFHSNRCHPERTEGSAFRLSPYRALSLFLARPLFSYSYALFCHNENDNLFVFRRFRTLSRKHPGWGYLLQAKIFSFGNLTTHYSPLSTISFTIRTSKTQHLKPFRINTYEKKGEGAQGVPVRDSHPNLPSRANRAICSFAVRRQLASHYSLPTIHCSLRENRVLIN
jgi:hypothetical protein